jgi:hypothetical protein
MRPNESDDVLREIRAELMAVAPSPAFAAGVRARVERRTGAGFMWLSTAAAAVIVAVVGLGVAKWDGRTDPEPAHVAAVAAASSPMASVGLTTIEPAVSRAFVRAPRKATAVRAAIAEPRLEVLVPPDEAIAVRRMLAGYVAGRRVSGAPSSHTFDETTGELKEPAPIDIVPVRVDLLPVLETRLTGRDK